jgi:MoaA/NifB/PqqE/SkfB family radical SAM enzyme
MLWSLEGLSVFVDLSTYCNAGCPQCHRTEQKGGLGKVDWLPLVQWSLEEFKNAFPPKELKHIRRFKLCGTWGDPMMNKDIYDIVKYVMDNTLFTTVSIDTNGSIRNSDFWWDFGVMGGERLEVIFDIDGIDQAMHEKYRRFTSLEKVLDNMATFAQTRAIAKSQTILFKHNQDYKDDILKLVKSNGSTGHEFVISDRFEGKSTINGKRYFYGVENEKEYLEPANPKVLTNPRLTGAYVPTTERVNNVQKMSVHELKPEEVKQVAELSSEIVCRWARPRNEIVVNPDGQVMPCCFHANAHYQSRVDPTCNPDLDRNDIYATEYNNNLKKYNVFHTPLSEIINSEWYKKTLPNSMKGDNPVPQCERHCSNRISKTHQLRDRHVTK